jgi:Protein of unknown function (DUF2281)
MLEREILKNIEKLPESVQQAVFDYTDFLVKRYAESSPAKGETAKRGGLGIWQGKIWMSDDFDEPLDDLKDYM